MRFIGSGEKRNKPKFRLRLFLFYFTFWGFPFIPLILKFGQVFSTSASLLQSEPKNNDFFLFCFAFPVSHSGHLVAPGMWTLEEREEVNDVRIGTAIITTLSTAGHTGVSSLRQPIAVNETQRHFWTFLKKENGNGMKEDCNPVNWIQSTTWMQTSYSLSVSTRWWRMMAMHLTCGKVK